LIGQNVVIRAANHRYDDPFVPIHKQGWVGGNIAIGNDVWIAANAVILPGVTIGDGAVVAAGAVVTRNVPAFEVWGGVPASFIKRRGG
jgi:acetyltransferase-like isoleucine patch superfamily enzyme